MILIGLIGCKNSGKDTVADFLVEKHDFKKKSFADTLKKMCKLLFRLEDCQLHDALLKEEMDPRWDMTPRKMMQLVGTDMVRNVLDQNFWLKHMDLYLHEELPERLVVPDVRFQNEADWIRKHNGVLIRITDNRKSFNDNHASETEQFTIDDDLFIFNKKDGIENFYNELQPIIEPILTIQKSVCR